MDFSKVSFIYKKVNYIKFIFRTNKSDLYAVFDFKHNTLSWYYMDISNINSNVVTTNNSNNYSTDASPKRHTSTSLNGSSNNNNNHILKKYKIQFKFNDIIGMSLLPSNVDGTLDLTIELKEKPSFYKKQERISGNI